MIATKLARHATRGLHATRGQWQKLHFGRFTQQEYDEAARVVRGQIEQLERQIKGDGRARLAKMETIPARASAGDSAAGGAAPATATGPGKPSSLHDIFVEAIRTTGPLLLSAYMRQCLTHPDYGYYTTRDPLDARTGDFITSPEILLVFGEMVGVWLFSVWSSQGRPRRIQVVEFGPGRGTLVHDVMHTFTRLCGGLGLQVEATVVLIEASRVLRREQRRLLCGGGGGDREDVTEGTTKWGHAVRWVDTEREVVDSPPVANYVVAHEFFDALPIKAFEHQEGGWRELLVEHTASAEAAPEAVPEAAAPEPAAPEASGSAPETSPAATSTAAMACAFHLTVSPRETPACAIPKNNPRLAAAPVGARVEVCPDAEVYMARMARLVHADAGAVLVIDYGALAVPDNTLRGIHQHRFVSPFYRPGDVDLSADVDFGSLASVARLAGRVVCGPVEQGDWLHEVGIGHRVDQIIRRASSEDEQDRVYQLYQRLTARDAMGGVYKVMAVLPAAGEVPVGFAGGDAST